MYTLISKGIFEWGVAAYALNTSTWETETVDLYVFEASLSIRQPEKHNRGTLSQEKKKTLSQEVVVHTFSPCSWKAEKGGSL